MLKVFMANSGIFNNCTCWVNDISRALVICNDGKILTIGLLPPVTCRTQQPNASGKESDDCKMNRAFCKSVRTMMAFATAYSIPKEALV